MTQKRGKKSPTENILNDNILTLERIYQIWAYPYLVLIFSQKLHGLQR